MTPYPIVLADDHPMFRQGLKKIIEEWKGMAVVGEVSSGLELLNLLKKMKPSMVILDLSMPNLRGIEAAREIKTCYPDMKILILTMYKKKEYLFQAISAGADGYLLKDDSCNELFSAIESIRGGKIYLSPLLSTELTGDLLDVLRGGGNPLDEALTTREREILKLIAEGKSSKEIAALLFISPRTVQHHRASIMKKLNLKKIADLIKYAIRKGYISEII
jgi:DNA-binding NarL/FixJ family response regulator